jgi:protein-disulfide isomerase/thiol-disulfide isomerase/thioredoxin/uncharacterized membrane protein
MKQSRLIAFLVACAGAAGWAFHLIGKHNEAIAEVLVPGALCGPDGGCSQVLGSDYSEVFGIAVSAPAVPLYLGLLVVGILVMKGKVDAARLASLATAAGIGGVLFGGYLLYRMIVDIAHICPYCLIMDGLNVAVLITGASLHPDGIVAGFKSVGSVFARLTKPGVEWGVGAVVVVGTILLTVLHPTPPEPPPPDPILTLGQGLGTTPSPAQTKTASTPTPTGPRPTAIPGTTTRPLILPKDVHVIDLDSTIPVRGPADAAVTIVLFEDFQCPFCRKLSGNIEILSEEMGDDLRLAFMHYPMHKKCNDTGLKKSMHAFACNAAIASVCAHEQGKFWELHDVMFRNSTRLRNKHLAKYARSVGLDMKAYTACTRNPDTLEKVKADARIGKSLGVTGTPALFINGRKLVGAQPVTSLRAAIAEVRANPGAEALVRLDVAVEDELEGSLEGVPTTVAVVGRRGSFTIDAFESSIVGGKAISQAGAESAGGVTWHAAQAACEASGKRLCTEEEWLTACTGAIPKDENRDGVFSNDTLVGRQHSYGEYFRQGWCADSRKKNDERLLTTGTHPRCATPTGIYDLEGVHKEWVGLTPDRAALKGGSYYSGTSARCAYHKDTEAPDKEDPSIGFRCCSGEAAAEIARAQSRFPGGKVGEKIRDWNAPLLDGGAAHGTATLKGKPYIMTFWASWCGPCKKELPMLAELYQEYKSQGLEVVGVNVDADPAAAEKYLQENPLPFPIVADGKKAVMGKFDTRGVPTTFWVKRDGTIRKRSVGFDEGGKPRMIEDVLELLK